MYLLTLYYLFTQPKMRHIMKVGYARVSKSSQHLDQQVNALKNAGCEEIFTDIASGANAKRSGIDDAIKFMRDNVDVLVVWKIDRLGRSLSHLVKTVENLGKRGIGFKSLNDPIDTTTPAGKLIFGIFASLAEFELALIKERTQAGLQAARARGKKGGRRPSLNETQTETLITLYQSKRHSISEICRQLKISRKTFYNYLNKNDQLRM